ncbi:hypothetical protein VP01_474g1 [Puccinia sorghi]|uniref:Uncharacterized protein n=1 Tax=Puccinia sorghi TaxID=27349 RepID=A0A0L6UNN5_9BASI|nr:hypothetical protein VP01_474g1 [Puccinia sorghi]
MLSLNFSFPLVCHQRFFGSLDENLVPKDIGSACSAPFLFSVGFLTKLCLCVPPNFEQLLKGISVVPIYSLFTALYEDLKPNFLKTKNQTENKTRINRGNVDRRRIKKETRIKHTTWRDGKTDQRGLLKMEDERREEMIRMVFSLQKRKKLKEKNKQNDAERCENGESQMRDGLRRDVEIKLESVLDLEVLTSDLDLEVLTSIGLTISDFHHALVELGFGAQSAWCTDEMRKLDFNNQFPFSHSISWFLFITQIIHFCSFFPYSISLILHPFFLILLFFLRLVLVTRKFRTWFQTLVKMFTVFFYNWAHKNGFGRRGDTGLHDLISLSLMWPLHTRSFHATQALQAAWTFGSSIFPVAEVVTICGLPMMLARKVKRKTNKGSDLYPSACFGIDVWVRGDVGVSNYQSKSSGDIWKPSKGDNGPCENCDTTAFLLAHPHASGFPQQQAHQMIGDTRDIKPFEGDCGPSNLSMVGMLLSEQGQARQMMSNTRNSKPDERKWTTMSENKDYKCSPALARSHSAREYVSQNVMVQYVGLNDHRCGLKLLSLLLFRNTRYSRKKTNRADANALVNAVDLRGGFHEESVLRFNTTSYHWLISHKTIHNKEGESQSYTHVMPHTLLIMTTRLTKEMRCAPPARHQHPNEKIRQDDGVSLWGLGSILHNGRVVSGGVYDFVRENHGSFRKGKFGFSAPGRGLMGWFRPPIRVNAPMITKRLGLPQGLLLEARVCIYIPAEWSTPFPPYPLILCVSLQTPTTSFPFLPQIDFLDQRHSSYWIKSPSNQPTLHQLKHTFQWRFFCLHQSPLLDCLLSFTSSLLSNNPRTHNECTLRFLSGTQLTMAAPLGMLGGLVGGSGGGGPMEMLGGIMGGRRYGRRESSSQEGGPMAMLSSLTGSGRASGEKTEGDGGKGEGHQAAFRGRGHTYSQLQLNLFLPNPTPIVRLVKEQLYYLMFTLQCTFCCIQATRCRCLPGNTSLAAFARSSVPLRPIPTQEISWERTHNEQLSPDLALLMVASVRCEPLTVIKNNPNTTISCFGFGCSPCNQSKPFHEGSIHWLPCQPSSLFDATPFKFVKYRICLLRNIIKFERKPICGTQMGVAGKISKIRILFSLFYLGFILKKFGVICNTNSHLNIVGPKMPPFQPSMGQLLVLLYTLRLLVGCVSKEGGLCFKTYIIYMYYNIYFSFPNKYYPLNGTNYTLLMGMLDPLVQILIGLNIVTLKDLFYDFKIRKLCNELQKIIVVLNDQVRIISIIIRVENEILYTLLHTRELFLITAQNIWIASFFLLDFLIKMSINLNMNSAKNSEINHIFFFLFSCKHSKEFLTSSIKNMIYGTSIMKQPKTVFKNSQVFEGTINNGNFDFKGKCQTSPVTASLTFNLIPGILGCEPVTLAKSNKETKIIIFIFYILFLRQSIQNRSGRVLLIKYYLKDYWIERVRENLIAMNLFREPILINFLMKLVFKSGPIYQAIFEALLKQFGAFLNISFFVLIHLFISKTLKFPLEGNCSIQYCHINSAEIAFLVLCTGSPCTNTDLDFEPPPQELVVALWVPVIFILQSRGFDTKPTHFGFPTQWMLQHWFGWVAEPILHPQTWDIERWPQLLHFSRYQHEKYTRLKEVYSFIYFWKNHDSVKIPHNTAKKLDQLPAVDMQKVPEEQV